MKKEMKTFKMSNYWKILSSRILGKIIFDEAAIENFNVVFDFEGVDMVNSSFTDELFWKMIEKNILNFKIKNIENELIKRLIFIAIEWRRQKELA